MKNWLIFLGLGIVYFALAFRNPFKINNLISNLEPGPDVFYYSVPTWNLIHGNGFKMAAYGIEIKKLVPPAYGIFLLPYFKVFNDVRSYYFANLLLGFISIFLFLKLVDVFFGKDKWCLKIALGLVLVTNFYFYNLASLLMAENLLIPLTLAASILMLDKFNIRNLILSLLVAIILVFTKLSSYPVLFVFALVVLIKITKSGILLKIPKKIYWFLIPILGAVLIFLFIKIVLPNILAMPSVSSGFSPVFIKKTLPIFLKEFIGIDGNYLWYHNQQIEKFVGILSLIGVILCLILKKYRNKTLILGSIIMIVTVFHSMMNFPEGRYISTVIPIFLIFTGVILNLIKGPILAVIFLGIYFLSKGNVNGFYERKATSLKRQVLNNQLKENEVPWNYKAVENFNSYFNSKNENVYLASLINPFYIMYFGNANYQYLPVSTSQEFSGSGKGYIDAMLKQDGSIVALYKRLLNEGNKIYLTNYYLKNYKGSKDAEFYNLEKVFKLTQVKDGCLDECKIYNVELKSISPNPSLTRGEQK